MSICPQYLWIDTPHAYGRTTLKFRFLMGIFKFSDPPYGGSNEVFGKNQNFPLFLNIKLHLKMPVNFNFLNILSFLGGSVPPLYKTKEKQKEHLKDTCVIRTGRGPRTFRPTQSSSSSLKQSEIDKVLLCMHLAAMDTHTFIFVRPISAPFLYRTIEPLFHYMSLFHTTNTNYTEPEPYTMV